MSPSRFNDWLAANEIAVHAAGSMNAWNVWNDLGVRHFPKKDIGINLTIRCECRRPTLTIGSTPMSIS